MAIFEQMEKTGVRNFTVIPDSASFPGTEMVVELMRQMGHEKLHFICHPDVNLRAIIAIHDRTLGKQALGGIRMLPYKNEEEMIMDVLRLSGAMTYKAAWAGIEKGGGKSVIWGNPKDKNAPLLQRFAKEIEALRGKYIGGEDMNISVDDVELMRSFTSYVTGLPKTYINGKYRGSGDPSPVTAQGTVYGIEACLKFLRLGPLADKTVAIQGVGKVGFPLAELLRDKRVAQIIVSDTDPKKIAHFQKEFAQKAPPELRVQIVTQDEIFSQYCDIFAPCATGAILNRTTIPLLRCRIVAGAANNQLEDADCGQMLMERGILYAPDYVINAGGLINVDDETHPDGYSELRVQQKLENIFPNLMRVFWLAQELERPTGYIADLLAEEKIQVKRLMT